MTTSINDKNDIFNVKVFIAGAAHEFRTCAEYTRFCAAIGKVDVKGELQLEFDRFVEDGVMYSLRYIRDVAICFPLYFSPSGESISTRI